MARTGTSKAAWVLALGLACCVPKAKDTEPVDTGEPGDTDCVPTEEVPYDGIDQDCDGADLTDVDEDGHDTDAAGGDDCDDLNPDISPSAPELCNEVDDDCDGRVDVMVAGQTHATIQEAMDAACEEGDEVLVAAGTYYENLVWPTSRELSLRSIDGPELTIVDGSTCANGADTCSVLIIVEAEHPVHISGLTINGGLGSNCDDLGIEGT